ADRVTSLILAPETLADRFDELGCLLPAAWAAANVPIRDDQIARVDGPADQAEEVTRWLASLGGRYRADQITIALPDEGLAQHLQRQLAQFGLASRWRSAQCLSQTG